MKNITNIILLVLAMTASFCQAQEELPVLSADRPGNTWGAEVLAVHKVSWENGFCFESSDGAHTMTIDNTILRYGIFQNAELRVGTSFLRFNEGQGTTPVFGISPLTIGTKIKVYESTNWLPSIGILAEFQSPHIGSKDLLPSYLAPSMYVLFEHSLNDLFWLCYNAGLLWDGETAAPQTFLSLALGFNITDNVGAFVETYNYLHPEGEHQFMSEFGFSWMVSRRLQLDIECDLDWQQLGKYYAVGCGVAWMIN